MSTATIHTNHEMHSSQVSACLKRYHAGDGKATSELFQHCTHRFRLLARKMLHRYPVVRRWEQTDDVLQSAIVRLQKAIEATQITSSTDLARMASTMIRRELIDLSRHYQGRNNLASHHHSPFPIDAMLSCHPTTSRAMEDNLQLWAQVHNAIQQLADEHQQLFDYLWYQGLSQSEVAVLQKLSLSTVKRRWQEARLALISIIGDNWPE
jgi:RNA polymerase sigma factor (sigma-70 family)